MQYLGGEKTQLDVIANAAGAIFNDDAKNIFPQNLTSLWDILKQIANEDFEPKIKQGDYMERNEQERVTKTFGNQ